jgi:hypothetical protein
MSSIAHTPSNKRFNLRALLAGGTVTTSLVGATLLAFLSLAVYVGFDELPFGGDAADGDAISIGPPVAGPLETAAAAGGTAGGAGAVAPAAAATAAAPASPAATPTAPAGTPATVPVGDGPDTSVPPGGDASPTAPGAPGTPGAASQPPGALGDTVQDVEQTTDPVADLPLSEVTDDVTGPIDQTAGQALNEVGGLLGNPELGDQLTDRVDEVTDAALGSDGAVDQLLP